MKEDREELPTLTIKVPPFFALDYVDLLGDLHCISLIADDDKAAIDAVRGAWNSQLLWYFRLHLPLETLSETRAVPWSPEDLNAVLRASQLAADIESSGKRFERSQQRVIWGDKTSFAPDRRRDISELASSYSETVALKLTYEQHVGELASRGVKVPAGKFEEVAHTIKAVRAAANTLEEIRSVKRMSELVTVPYISRVPALEFVDRLPRNDSIFSLGLKLSEQFPSGH